MKKFEWNTEGGITKSTTNTVEDLLVNLCFTKLKELKLTNGIDKKPKKDKNNNNKTQRKDRILPLECFEEKEDSGRLFLNDARVKVQSLQPKRQMSDPFCKPCNTNCAKLNDADVFSGGRPATFALLFEEAADAVVFPRDEEVLLGVVDSPLLTWSGVT